MQMYRKVGRNTNKSLFFFELCKQITQGSFQYGFDMEPLVFWTGNQALRLESGTTKRIM